MLKFHLARLAIFLLLSAAPALAFALTSLAKTECPTLNANDAQARSSLMHYVCYYQASPGEPAHQAMRPGELPEHLEWIPARGNNLTFTQTRSVYWIRLNIKNSGSERQLWYLNLNYPLLDEVSFWWSSNPRDVLVTGDQHRFGSRAVDYRYFLFPITLNGGETRSITLRVRSSGALNIPLKLETPAELVASSNHKAVTHGLFYGAILVLAIFNLLLFFSSGTAYYFYNALYMAAMGLFLFTMGGFTNQYFWPENPRLANTSIPLTLVLCALAMNLFGRSFLEVEKSTLADRTLTIFIWICAGFMGLTLILPYSQAILLNTALGLILILALSIIAVSRWHQGYQPAKWYVLAWVIMASGALIYAAAAFGYLEDFLARESLMQIAIGGQLVLLNYAMVQRWRLLSKRLLEVEQQTRAELAEKVQERTAQLSKAMQKLTEANRKLAALSLNDPLTDLYNRRHMDKALAKMCAESRRTGQPLTLVLLDADHFKLINDTWGHAFGDTWLQHIAEILNEHVKRPRDIAVRFGGEEFALLLPGTDTNGARILCEAILEDMRASMIAAPDGSDTRLTLSAGIATMLPGEDQQELFGRADRALYKAKELGRNRVVLASA